jgi:hypothetical protein
VRRPKRRGGNHQRTRSLYRLPTWQEDPELEAEKEEEDGARMKPKTYSQSVLLPSPAPTTSALPTTTHAPWETTGDPDQNGCRKEAAGLPRPGGMMKPALRSSLARPGERANKKKKKRVSWKLD